MMMSTSVPSNLFFFHELLTSLIRGFKGKQLQKTVNILDISRNVSLHFMTKCKG